MPSLSGSGRGDEIPVSSFFNSLAELDNWSDTESKIITHRVIPYFPRHHQYHPTISSQGGLLVCHDFKGGYSEKPEETTYTFNFWPLCDTFIYFSHHRVTIPPSGWISSAHRQGVKILGTLHHAESETDGLRLLFGRLPASKTGPVVPPSTETSAVPVSPHYARLLACLAYQRGFDGYLLNFEWHLRAESGIGHARALTAWISLLRAELKAKVGPHAEVIWYDSVIFNGLVRWQDRLNSYNLPFFLPSTGFFTNYTWPSVYPSLTAQFFSSLEPSLISRTGSAKTLQDIYVGIDIWGRGSHGGGGFGAYRALEHINPTSLGLSVALFGPGWTWETIQDKAGFSWHFWWETEKRLWIGSVAEDLVDMPPTKGHNGEPDCLHGPFRPFSDFFAVHTPPDPALLPFCTTFSPGIGFAWFVDGREVMASTKDGWTDIDKQNALGDRLWPRPAVQWEDREGTTDPVPESSSTFCFDDAWLGGNSLRVTFSASGSDAEDAFFRCVWLPIQSLGVTLFSQYTARIVFKVLSTVGPPVDFDAGLSVRSPGSTLEVSGISSAEELVGGWTCQTLTFTLSENQKDEPVTVGLVLGYATEDPSQELQFSILLGQLAVHLAPLTALPHLSVASPRILWADFQRIKDRKSGVLTWEIAAAFPRISLPDTFPTIDNPTPLWSLDTSDRAFPSCAYFNIYAGAALQGPTKATFIGTTGLDGRANRFYVDWAVLPDVIKELREIRFYVQGVTDHGEVMKWEQCAFVDASG
ncbi:glycosyl hydrolase family 85-domain-containing protein [Multifurca ochricompacta]|uniref:Glycosyl hydrolase family 85-domain-containing protein n=1 Tax=Multifurca ochricompacta TaxID=376703 RepID=A0AAD4QMT4_9AGAM|nr:glycosyl hydrolase family 85-domain-containing protein [Multifurca ochricompacta]